MALFMVVALKSFQEVVDSAVSQEFPHDSYHVEPGKWIVSTDLTTAKQVSDKLGSIATAHLVISLRGYYGRARPELWEWLAAQSEKANA